MFCALDVLGTFFVLGFLVRWLHYTCNDPICCERFAEKWWEKELVFALQIGWETGRTIVRMEKDYSLKRQYREILLSYASSSLLTKKWWNFVSKWIPCVCSKVTSIADQNSNEDRKMIMKKYHQYFCFLTPTQMDCYIGCSFFYGKTKITRTMTTEVIVL